MIINPAIKNVTRDTHGIRALEQKIALHSRRIKIKSSWVLKRLYPPVDHVSINADSLKRGCTQLNDLITIVERGNAMSHDQYGEFFTSRNRSLP